VSIFALVHGGWHGPWCWERLTGPLRERGHDVVVPDLPSDDTELGLEDYADTIERALGDADDVILVPHSLGGLVGPVVARRRRLTALVYLCGLVPEPGLSFLEQASAAEEPILTIAGGREMDEQGRSHWPDPPADLRVESIVGTEDGLVNPDWSRRVARERLGVEPVELPTGHFPMITHPKLLADELAKLDAQ
jgi:pimeloyl-ACP methyl ester carboxylesterase